MTPLKARILLADDHAVVRRGLRLVLEAQPDLGVVAEVGDGIEAMRRTLAEDLDLAILDITMPRLTGLHAARELHRRRPKLRVLMLWMHENERYLYEALKVGASGYVLKTAADRDLVDACRAALRGEGFLYPGAMTPLIAEGYSGREIADALVISAKTVERHRANVLEKLEVRGRVELTRHAIRRGLIDP